ncbi:MAG: Xaa-Pro dipeptidase [Gammaproteobacteria bacterium]|nr:Xaa-Pro dipeptidase [Gammaproteobacteria bacterium]
MEIDWHSLYTEHLATLTKRAEAALDHTGLEHLLIHSGFQHSVFFDDNAYPFRVNPQFNAWVPLYRSPECLLVITPGEKPVLAFFAPDDFWHKSERLPEDFWTEHFDIVHVGSRDDIKPLLPKDRAHAAFIGEPFAELDDWAVQNVNPEDLLTHMDYQRAWKTPFEHACQREANRRGARAHIAAERAFRDGLSEYDIHLAYLAAAVHLDEELPYNNIIALNENGATLHYQQRERSAPVDSRSFLIDAGAQWNGYASDITRTHSRDDNHFAALVARMDEEQRKLCDSIRPGMEYVELQRATHRVVAGLLNEFGMAKGSVDELIDTGVTRAFFPHGIGHYIGVQVHDVGGLLGDEKGKLLPRPDDQPFLRLTRKVDVDQVFTVEPGLYVIDTLLEKLPADARKLLDDDGIAKFRPYGGVRIEDNVRVTRDGHENFTRDAFRSLEG